MTAHDPRSVRLADYRPFSHIVDTVDLTFRLHPTATRVIARLALRPNPAAGTPAPVVLDGDGRLVRLDHVEAAF